MLQGSTFVYVSYIHPFLLLHEKDIDATWSQAKVKAKAAGLDYMRRAWLAVREAVMGAILAVSCPIYSLYMPSMLNLSTILTARRPTSSCSASRTSRTGCPARWGASYAPRCAFVARTAGMDLRRNHAAFIWASSNCCGTRCI